MPSATQFLLPFLLGNLAAASPTSERSITTVSIDTGVKYQEIDGFGCSQAFQRAEDVFGKYGLPKVNQTFVLDLLFDKEAGAGFTILRNGIGSSNTSTSNLMNSIEPYSPGSPSAKPKYVWDGYDSGQFPLAQEAYSRGLNSLYSNAWSAPAYMKTNLDENYGGYLCGVTNTSCASGNWMQAYANYLVQYIRFYELHEVDVTHLGFLNEPQLAPTYASMLSDGTQAADFIRVLAKMVKEAGLDVKLTCCDAMGWDLQKEMLPGLKAGPDPAINYLSVITAHGYDSAPTYRFDTDLKVWESEWADLTGAFTPYTFFENGSEGEGMTWARRIQVALTDANVSAFLYWIGAENSTTNSGLINMINTEVIPSKRFWAFAQFSRFVRPGARRVSASSSQDAVTASAFVNSDGVLAAQLINNGTQAYNFKLRVRGLENSDYLRPYITNNQHDIEPLSLLKVNSNGQVSGNIPARSMLSLVSTCSHQRL
ncbi:glycoside hydrolase superfamily [Aspergillus insuetus]